jgi:ribosome-binding ATPase YchF (GTP1/OBG family)
MSTVEKRSQTIGRDVKKGDKDAIKFAELLEKLKVAFNEGKLANRLSYDEDELRLLRDLHLITMKPFLYVLNKQSGGKNLDLPAGEAGEMDPRYVKLLEYFKANNFHYVVVDAKIEDELKEFEGDEKEMMRKELGAHDNGIDGLIRAGYDLLGLETYLTTGEMETRAWTVKKGSTAPRAAAAIHTDFEQKFIRAEVVSYDDLVRVGGFAEAKAQGVLRTEGKEYIIKDGDVVEFKI